MSDARNLYLFDDAVARSWTPFATTRPVSEMLFGCMTQRERVSRFTGDPCSGLLLCDGALAGFQEGESPPVTTCEQVPSEGIRIVLSSRFVPDGILPEATVEIRERTRLEVAGQTVGWVVPDGVPAPSEAELMKPEGATEGPGLKVEGRLLEWPWEMIEGNTDRIIADVALLDPPDASFRISDLHRVGDHHIALGDDVTVDPGIFVDVSQGPIWLDHGVRVSGPARLTGPLYVGPGSSLLGGVVGTSSIGPVCKVRGEVEASIFLGYSNKAHDGYIGHALLGRWVNLGASTTNSDLKNNYGTVSIQTSPDVRLDSGLLKIGALLGDHVKTGIGTLLNTGVVVGTGSNVFGGGVVGGYVPPFSWGGRDGFVEYRLDRFLNVVEAAMARRNQTLSGEMRSILEQAWASSAPERSGSSS